MKGLKQTLEITNKIPKNKTFFADRYLGNLFLNNGYDTQRGDVATLELRSMLKLVELAEYCHSVPGYRWHVLNLVVKKSNAQVVLREDQRFLGVDFDVATYLRDLSKLMLLVKDENTGKLKLKANAKVFYRWNIECSPKGGFHAHVAMFIPGSVFSNGGLSALLTAKDALKESDAYDYSLVSVEAQKWSFSRVQDQTAIDYFDSLNYRPDHSEGKYGFKLGSEIDYRYLLYVLSYQSKTYTKLGERRLWNHGTYCPKVQTVAANEVLTLLAA